MEGFFVNIIEQTGTGIIRQKIRLSLDPERSEKQLWFVKHDSTRQLILNLVAYSPDNIKFQRWLSSLWMLRRPVKLQVPFRNLQDQC